MAGSLCAPHLFLVQVPLPPEGAEKMQVQPCRQCTAPVLVVFTAVHANQGAYMRHAFAMSSLIAQASLVRRNAAVQFHVLEIISFLDVTRPG